jgi:prepilin-type N-terminal cleavage/methylation domain-containing protein/prepilin-type processing-associated H-X9-DG protein
MKRRAFTIIELMIVIVIIGMLFSLLMPLILRARESARQVACGSNLRQLHHYFVMYANNNGGWIPRHGQGRYNVDPPEYPRFLPDKPFWPIVVDVELLSLPTENAINDAIEKLRIFRCPSQPAEWAVQTYLVNAFYITERYRIGGGGIAGLTKIAAVRRSSDCILLTEIRDGYYRNPSIPLGPDMHPGALRGVWSWSIWWPMALPYYADREPSWIPWMARSRHGVHRVNALYFDGSVRLVDSMALRARDFDDGIRGESQYRRLIPVPGWWMPTGHEPPYVDP